MLEISFIRENAKAVKEDLKKRDQKDKIKLVDEVLELDKDWRELKGKLDELRHKKNNASNEINQARKEGKDIKSLVEEIKKLPEKIAKGEEKEKELLGRIRHNLMLIPNVLHESVPKGKDDSESQVVRKVGKPKTFKFELKPHGELAENLGMADFKRATKVSGSGFVYLKDKLAKLDLALQHYAIDFLTKRGFTLVTPPLMMKKEAYEGVTSLEDFQNVMYKIDDEELYMIATSEHPLVAMHMDELLEEKSLPIKLCGLSSCFRKEIGSHGVDTRGLFRMHQFNKVEQVIICAPEDSWKLHEELQKNSEEMFKKLEIPFRVVNICTGDIGMIAAKKYDIEAWFPREKEYKEVTSCSNCASYQAVRLNMKYRKGEEKKYCHTLNNTGIATSRAMRAILENFQNEDGSVDIPKALHKYTGFKKIEKKK